MKRFFCFLIFSFVFFLIFVSGCTFFEQSFEKGRFIFENDPPIYFGVFPFLEKEILSEGFNPLLKYLSHHLHKKVQIKFAENYSSLEELALKKKIHFMWFNTRKRSKSEKLILEPLCRPISEEGSYYRGIIIAKKASGLSKISDLAGKTFAYIDPISNSGFVYPNELFKKMNIEPTSFFGEIKFTGNHDKCLNGVLNGDYDAGVVTDMFFKNTGRFQNPSNSELEIIASTSKILLDPFVSIVGLERGLKTKIIELLTDPEKYDESGPAFAKLFTAFGIKGFEKLTSLDEVDK
ncbi:MAG: phosphate/phosphite/phosphonate ABC transporter substrate-binding protein [Candidatus Riflebacteria bacterium]|nr:phosphate/phosphite/phosphonate ABC transporter substrate-binding protein [Candidatus Riflebacteria bacterium]